MADWVNEELELLRSFWPDLEFQADGNGNWVLRKDFLLPEGWNKQTVDIAIRIPTNLPAEQPYGIWVRGGLLLANGSKPDRYDFPVETPPFPPDEQWGRFSWQPETWTPGAKPGEGTGMIHFASSISRRLTEAN